MYMCVRIIEIMKGRAKVMYMCALQVSIIYILIIHKARNSETFKFVHLFASVTFNAPYFHYIIQTIGHVSIPK